jgi:ribosomal protein S18 acetylase RimI-like enzyme
LEVRAGNEAAQLFYKQMGYRELAHLPGYYQGIEAALRMGRDLSRRPLDQENSENRILIRKSSPPRR